MKQGKVFLSNLVLDELNVTTEHKTALAGIVASNYGVLLYDLYDTGNVLSSDLVDGLIEELELYIGFNLEDKLDYYTVLDHIVLPILHQLRQSLVLDVRYLTTGCVRELKVFEIYSKLINSSKNILIVVNKVE